MSLFPHPNRYQQMEYRRSGRSGIKLPAISLGLWHNFGDSTRSITAVSCCVMRLTLASRTST